MRQTALSAADFKNLDATGVRPTVILALVGVTNLLVFLLVLRFRGRRVAAVQR